MHEIDLSRRFIDIIPKTMRSIRSELRGVAQADFTVPQFRVMAHLARGSLTSSELSEALGMSLPGVSRMVDGLVRRGVLTRIPSPEDRRSITLGLSARGKRRYLAVRRATQATFSRMFSRLDFEQRTALAAGLDVLDRIFTL